MSDIAAILFHVAIGFAVGGLIGSLHQLLTRNPPSFQNIGYGLLAKSWAVLVIVFAGPLIIMRNALRARRIEHRPAKWLAMSTALATSWSFISGVVILQLLIVMGTPIGA